jgi:hypothetical protein
MTDILLDRYTINNKKFAIMHIYYALRQNKKHRQFWQVLSYAYKTF